MKTKFRFSKLALESVVCPDGMSKVRVHDLEVPSLTLVALPSGSKIFRFYKKINGRPVEVRIGTLEECTLDQARRRAVELVGEYIAGRDPAAEKRANREAATLVDAWQAYRVAVQTKSPRTLAEDAGL